MRAFTDSPHEWNIAHKQSTLMGGKITPMSWVVTKCKPNNTSRNGSCTWVHKTKDMCLQNQTGLHGCINLNWFPTGNTQQSVWVMLRIVWVRRTDMNLPNRTGTGFSLFQMLHTGPHHAQEKPHLYKHHAPLPWRKLQRVVHTERSWQKAHLHLLCRLPSSCTVCENGTQFFFINHLCNMPYTSLPRSNHVYNITRELPRHNNTMLVLKRSCLKGGGEWSSPHGGSILGNKSKLRSRKSNYMIIADLIELT